MIINIQNIDYNKCFKWCLIRYVHPADHHAARIRKSGKVSARKPNFKDIKIQVEIRDIHKIEKRRIPSLLVL